MRPVVGRSTIAVRKRPILTPANHGQRARRIIRVMQIDRFMFAQGLALAPMAGVTDRVFRKHCRVLGAAMTTGEMVSSKPDLRATRKSMKRLDFSGEPSPRVVQIAGGDATDLAEAARANADAGVDIIDINFGCPAKKVCRKAAGSALMADAEAAAQIFQAVVAASPVPVTLKMRTGVSADRINAPRIARYAQEAGITALAVHGRTRDQHYQGVAEYETIAAVKAAVSIPVWANGDIDSPAKALAVKQATGADGLMIGRAACRRPWLFGQIAAALADRAVPAPPDLATEREWLLGLIEQIHDFYGEDQGVRIARKHIAWLLERHPAHIATANALMQAEGSARQRRLVDGYFQAVDQRSS